MSLSLLEKRQKGRSPWQCTSRASRAPRGRSGYGAVHVNEADKLLVEGDVVESGVSAHAGLEEVRDVEDSEEDAEPDEALLGHLVHVQLADEEQHLETVQAEGH